jgi:hypothetical protein
MLTNFKQTVTRTLSLCWLLLFVSSLEAQHNDSILEYTAWDGSHYAIKTHWKQFIRVSEADAKNGDWSRATLVDHIDYITFDGGKWAAAPDGRTFTHAPDGDFHRSHQDDIINYITWDGTKWTARILGNGEFQHLPFDPRGVPDDQTGPKEPDWQMHAKWCVNDRGSSHSVYLSSCKRKDQFESVIDCQNDADHSGRSAAAVSATRGFERIHVG